MHNILTLGTNGPFFEFSLCLSRACLGKMFVFIYKWRKKWRFSHPVPRTPTLQTTPLPSPVYVCVCVRNVRPFTDSTFKNPSVYHDEI